MERRGRIGQLGRSMKPSGIPVLADLEGIYCANGLQKKQWPEMSPSRVYMAISRARTARGRGSGGS